MRFHPVSLALAFALSATAYAQEIVTPGADMVVPGDWYVAPGYRNQSIKLPRIDNAMRALPSANALVSLRPEFTASGINGTIGYAFRENTLPLWMGTNVRAEVTGYWVTANHKFAAETPGTIPNISLFRIDGVTTGLSGLHLGTQSTIRATSQQWQAALRMLSDYALAPQWILSPEIAIVGGRQNDDYKLFERGQQTNLFNDRRTYDVDTTRIGGWVGSRITYKPIAWLALHAGGYVGAAHTSASLRAFEEFNSGVGITNVSVSTSRTTLALIAGGQAGVTLGSGGPVIFVVAGGIDYNSRVAGVRVPTFADPGPIRIEFQGAWNYNVTATVKLRLY